ncbi:hypothetical protein FLM55_02055 [Francisella sp. Scap27]|uniref:hypothetical protein n=1 Tax=Francisella sp. Scap27 TaxID=2589986 RepID=UPI0015B9CA63|nr:hypothetical protein [Francisella sp. Scap27]QLE78588.1 hypothetical protein FLM55_02055 [Francisella sp. Scap27]
MNTSFYFLQFASLIFGLIFAIKIIDFKKSAWVFYFLATVVGSFQFIDLSNFKIIEYLNNLPMYTHDLILSLIAILIYSQINIKPRAITKKNIFSVITLLLPMTIFMIVFYYLTIPSFVFVNADTAIVISITFSIATYLGSTLLVFGLISGLLINAICTIQFIAIDLFYMIKYDSFPLQLWLTIFFGFISFFIFLYGYNKNKKLLSH